MVDQTAAPDGGAPAYEPDAETQKKVSETLEKRDRFKKFRQSRDQQTFVNFAFLNGQQYVEWSAKNATLTVPPAPPHRIRLALNKIRPKIEARRAKIFRNRTRIECAPATADQQDRMNAKASTKALDYIMRKEKWEEKKRHAWMWAEVGGKGFLWLHWDPQALGQVLQEDPLSGEATPTEGVVGDVRLEVGSPFEVLVADPTNPSLAGQVEILRIKLRPVADMQGKYPEFAGVLVADAGGAEDLFRFERRIGTLSQTGWGGMSDTPSDEAGNKSQVMVTEHFKAPCATYPKGLYRVLVGKVLVHEGPLPFEMWDMPNPYPVVAFSDIASPAQFWNTTLIEQLIPLQREYNLARSKFAEWMRLNVNNKIIVWKQHRLPKNAWTCVDDQTTVLTRSGWKNYETLQVGEDVLSYDPVTRAACWLPALAVNIFDYAGELTSLQSREVDALVTPNHKWLLEMRPKGDRDCSRVQFTPTEDLQELSKGVWGIPTARGGALPGVGISESLAFMEVLGWIVSDGGFTESGIVISQAKKHGIERIRHVLATAGIPFTEGQGGRNMRRFYIPKAHADRIKQYLPNKVPQYDWLVECSAEQLTALLDGLMAGDGTVKKNGQRCYFSSDLELAEAVQTIGTLLGLRTSIVRTRPAHEKFFPGELGNKTYQCAAQYTVHLGSVKEITRRRPGNAQLDSVKFGSEYYEGKVWCPTVATHAVFFKRGHRVYVSGNSEPGEILELFWVPGLPPPMIIQPPPIGADFWNGIQLIGKEFDDISQVFPAAEGKAAGATSGFQTNLLQEATDSVHQPLLEHVLAQEEELARKMRRVMRLGYSVPRLISVTGKRLEPEVLEFKASQIDETGDVVVAAGGALPDLKATRISMVNDMFKSGILGNPAEPDTQRKALSLMNMGGADEALDQRQIDENLARIENLHFEHDTPVEPPVFYQDHQIHYETHIERLKSPDTLLWPEKRRLALITHTVATLDYLNPVAALEAAAQFGLNPPPRALSMLKQQQVLQSQAGTKDVDGTAAVPAGAPADGGSGPGPLPVS